MDATHSRLIVADLHSHFYPCFNTSQFFKIAAENLKQPLPNPTTDYASCLFLADLQWRSAETFFSLFDRQPELEITRNQGENDSYTVLLPDTAQISIVFGYQYITTENLEVLIYGLTEPLPEGLSTETALKLATEQGALAILPWGFGKWAFTRGDIIQSIISSHTGAEKAGFYVGDNGNRWRTTRIPRLISTAGQRNIWNLPGSDPLPFPSEVARVGSMSAVLKGSFDQRAPLNSIQSALSLSAQAPAIHGAGAPLTRFLKLQTGMQLRKQFRAFTNK